VPANRKAREELTNEVLNAKPGRFLTIVNRVGWHDETFVLPDEIFGKQDQPFGKSTALMVGGSVCGGGGNNGFLQSWRSTANGLEAVAALHNDGTLFLDELAQVEPQQASEIAYLLGNGIGKLRMTKSLAVRRPLTWNLLFLSAGEISLADHASSAGHRIKGGAEIRLLNVDGDASAGIGIFDKTPDGMTPEAFSRKLKAAARKFYGTPLRAFLAWITENRAEAEKTLQTWHADFCQSTSQPGAAGEVIRAANRFALIGAAGEIATLAKITGWKRGESGSAALRCFGDWLTARGHNGPRDIAEAIKQVWNFVHVHGAGRFASENQPSERIQNRAGFIGKGDDGQPEYLIFPEVFRKEVCAGFDYRTVARALAARGMLDTDGPHLAQKRNLPELGRLRVFALHKKIEN
jgi:putative DNA primase/helicase